MSTARSFAIMAFAGLAGATLVTDGSLAYAAGIKGFAPNAGTFIFRVGAKTASDIDRLIAQGQEALRRGDPDAAMPALDAAVALDAANAHAFSFRGAARMQKRDYDGAIADFDRAIALDATDVEAYRMRGNIWFLKRDRERAISDYNRAIEINPHDAVAYLLRGIYWIAQNNRASAMSDLDRAITEDPYSVEAYLQRGLLYEHDRKFDLAFADYDAAIRVSPYNARAYTRRGGIWLQRGPSEENLNRAIADLQQAVRVNSSDQAARGQLQQMIAMKELLQKAKTENRTDGVRTKAEAQ